MRAKVPKVPLKRSPSERKAEGKLHLLYMLCISKFQGGTPKVTIFGVTCPPSMQRGVALREFEHCVLAESSTLKISPNTRQKRGGVVLCKQIGHTGMRRKSSHFGNQKFDYKGLFPIITYRQRFQTTHTSSLNVGEVTITYGASPINSLHCYIASLFLKHYAVHIFDYFSDRAVYNFFGHPSKISFE